MFFQAHFTRKAAACLHIFHSVCTKRKAAGMVDCYETSGSSAESADGRWLRFSGQSIFLGWSLPRDKGADSPTKQFEVPWGTAR